MNRIQLISFLWLYVFLSIPDINSQMRFLHRRHSTAINRIKCLANILIGFDILNLSHHPIIANTTIIRLHNEVIRQDGEVIIKITIVPIHQIFVTRIKIVKVKSIRLDLVRIQCNVIIDVFPLKLLLSYVP